MVSRCHAQQAKKPFTVSDDIELSSFGDEAKAVRFSPDANYFAVWIERGRLDLNRVEDTILFYRSQDVENFLRGSDESEPPSPVWVVNRSDKEGPIISDWRWLADSSGLAFLGETTDGNKQLFLADLRKKRIEPLTPSTEQVEGFDINDRKHYVYLSAGRAVGKKIENERRTTAIVGTGRSISELLLPNDPTVIELRSSKLWAVVDGKHFEVKHNGTPLVVGGDFALSPDGRSLATIQPVSEVPVSWETLYPPPYLSSASRIQAGKSTSQYVRIDLQTGSIESLTEAPVSWDAGWGGTAGRLSWSSDGEEILLPGTFIKSKNETPSRPCVAVVDLASNTRTCVEILRRRTETGYEEGSHFIRETRFVRGEKQSVSVSSYKNLDYSRETTEYRRAVDGSWQVARQIKGIPEVGRSGFEVAVTQGVNEPPLLGATNQLASRAIWDPNPQFKNIELTKASVYKWKDQEGRDWRGGLFKPSDYKPGQRYPLVIQTHGFVESQFIPSGWGPPFAARELAATGIVVLQVVDEVNCASATPSEGPCAVSGYEAAANQLVSEGLVDPERIGIIGFSRTCFYVMETLTFSSLHLRAASITDGTMKDYFQYIESPEGESSEANAMIGAPPFGEGLQQWLKRSPGFNLDKITAPLLVVAEGPVSLLGMWGPYAGLHYLKKPVDLIMLNTDEHVSTNPAVRMASQGGSVDWFRFWLQDYEDPDPAKVDQYKRWRELRALQVENDRKSATIHSASNTH